MPNPQQLVDRSHERKKTAIPRNAVCTQLPAAPTTRHLRDHVQRLFRAVGDAFLKVALHPSIDPVAQCFGGHENGGTKSLLPADILGALNDVEEKHAPKHFFNSGDRSLRI